MKGTMCHLLQWVVVSVVLLEGSLAVGQQNAAPVTVSETSISKTEHGAMVSLRFTNVSAKGIVALVLVCSHYDDKGKIVSSGTQVAMRGAGQPGPRAFAAAESWNGVINIPVDAGGDVVRHSMYIDFVLFEDRSTWGQDSRRMSLNIAGLRSGIASERNRLKELLKRKGYQEVINDLNR